MESQLKQYAADHRYLLDTVARQMAFGAPVAVHLEEFYGPLVRASRKGELLPIDGMLVRDWNEENRGLSGGLQLGMRVYEIEGVRYVHVRAAYHDRRHWGGLDFVAVDRPDYSRLYRIARRCRDAEPRSAAPVLPQETATALEQNTLGYLEPANLRRVRKYGGRARRGVLLVGPSGTGKTMACRWLLDECRRRRWDWREITADSYRQARANDTLRDLFCLEGPGIVFFDGLDDVLRDRERAADSEAPSVFLQALDGSVGQEPIVHVFTSTCAPEAIDRAFKRPGRLDVVCQLKSPDAALRRELVERWHEDMRAAIGPEVMVETTSGLSFADLEELKNLLVARHLETEGWDWSWALEQFQVYRKDRQVGRVRRVGFGQAELMLNGAHNGV